MKLYYRYSSRLDGEDFLLACLFVAVKLVYGLNDETGVVGGLE
jgi:hypothetical protein